MRLLRSVDKRHLQLNFVLASSDTHSLEKVREFHKVCMCACICFYACVICMCIYMCACLCVCVCVCLFLCVFVCIYIYKCVCSVVSVRA